MHSTSHTSFSQCLTGNNMLRTCGDCGMIQSVLMILSCTGWAHEGAPQPPAAAAAAAAAAASPPKKPSPPEAAAAAAAAAAASPPNPVPPDAAAAAAAAAAALPPAYHIPASFLSVLQLNVPVSTLSSPQNQMLASKILGILGFDAQMRT